MNSLELLWIDLRRRFTAPINSVTFYVLVAAVVIGGGFEIWYQVVFKGMMRNAWDSEAISCALFGYFTAVVSAALVNFVREPQPYLRMFGLGWAGVFVLILLLTLGTDHEARLAISALGSVLAVGYWWAASGEKDCFRDINLDAPTPDPRSTPTSGNTNNWRTE